MNHPRQVRVPPAPVRRRTGIATLTVVLVGAASPLLIGRAVGSAEETPSQKYDVVLLRPSRFLAGKASRATAGRRYLTTARRIAVRAGLTCHVLTDEQVLKDGIPSTEFLFCAYSPDMQADVVAKVTEFLNAGGHALFCYYLPTPLQHRFGAGEPVYTPAGTEHRFAFVEPTAEAPPGMPKRIVQNSWNAYLLRDVVPPASVAAAWVAESDGKVTAPALVLTPEAAWFGHIFTDGDLDAKARFLLAVIGAFDPGIWKRALPRVVGQACVFRFAPSPGALVTWAERNRPSLLARLVADGLLAMRRQAAGPTPWRVYERLARVRTRAKHVYLRGFPSRVDRLRGAWVVSPRGVSDWGWEETARRARQLGLTDLFVRVEWTGQAHYRSHVLPMAVRDGDDPLQRAVAACHRHGVRIHAWFINHNWRTPPKSVIDRFAAEQRWQFSPEGENRVREGSSKVYWLNPAHPKNVKLQADMMSEVVRRYAVDGVHFDYIRYENYSGSYGPLDRRSFEKYVGRPVANWPADVLPKGALHEPFCEWRCEQVSNVVRTVSEAVRAVRATCKLSAAVYPSWPYHRTSVGQDWARWLREGWLDFVCPMTYDPPGYYDRHVDRVKRQRQAAGDKPLYVGLGAWLQPDAVPLAEQIYQDRLDGADGFVFFSLGERLMNEILPALNEGVLRRVNLSDPTEGVNQAPWSFLPAA